MMDATSETPWRRASQQCMTDSKLSTALKAQTLSAWSTQITPIMKRTRENLEQSMIWLGSNARKHHCRWKLENSTALCAGAMVVNAKIAHDAWAEIVKEKGIDEALGGQIEWDRAAREQAEHWVREIGGRTKLESTLDRYWECTRGTAYPGIEVTRIAALGNIGDNAWKQLEKAPTWLARVAARWIELETLSQTPMAWAAQWANRWIERVDPKRKVRINEMTRALSKWQWDRVEPPIGIMGLLENEGLDLIEKDHEISAAQGINLRPEVLIERAGKTGLGPALRILRKQMRQETTMEDAIDAKVSEWLSRQGKHADALDRMRHQWKMEDTLEGDGTRRCARLKPASESNHTLLWEVRMDSPEHIIAASETLGQSPQEIAAKYTSAMMWTSRSKWITVCPPESERSMVYSETRGAAASRVINRR